MLIQETEHLWLRQPLLRLNPQAYGSGWIMLIYIGFGFCISMDLEAAYSRRRNPPPFFFHHRTATT